MIVYIFLYLIISIVTFLLLGAFNKNCFTWVHVTFALLWPLTIIISIILFIFITVVIIKENHKKKKKTKNEKVQ